MEERIVKFIAALRSAGVRISLAESADAFRAVDSLGSTNRDIFRLSLQSTLVKEHQHQPVFEELFPVFFSSESMPPLIDLSKDLSQEEASSLADALQALKEQLREMFERLLRGEQLSKEELERLAKFIGLNQADDMRFREWMVQRMQRSLRFPEVRKALQELAEMLEKLGMNKERVDQLTQILRANMQSIEAQLRQFVGQRIAENMSQQQIDDGVEGLMNRPFQSLTDRDMERLRKEVQRLASVIRTRVALRQKRAHSGQLDAKATIRANLKHGSVPIELKHKQKILKPKLVVICDISTSMRHCSELMLSLIYALEDQISKTSAFAFIDHLEYISPDFESRDSREAVRGVLERIPAGYYNTDFGNSLENFTASYLDIVDSRTTFLVVGDGRNNYNDPRVDLFRMLARRSRRTIWLNPEMPVMWGTGDSDMFKYAPNCDVVLRASTLAELTVAIDKLLVYH